MLVSVFFFEVVQVVSVVRFRPPSLQIKSHHQTRSGDEIRRITLAAVSLH